MTGGVGNSTHNISGGSVGARASGFYSGSPTFSFPSLPCLLASPELSFNGRCYMQSLMWDLEPWRQFWGRETCLSLSSAVVVWQVSPPVSLVQKRWPEGTPFQEFCAAWKTMAWNTQLCGEPKVSGSGFQFPKHGWAFHLQPLNLRFS